VKIVEKSVGPEEREYGAGSGKDKKIVFGDRILLF
jgi:hypothetical protein